MKKIINFQNTVYNCPTRTETILKKRKLDSSVECATNSTLKKGVTDLAEDLNEDSKKIKLENENLKASLEKKTSLQSKFKMQEKKLTP